MDNLLPKSFFEKRIYLLVGFFIFYTFFWIIIGKIIPFKNSAPTQIISPHVKMLSVQKNTKENPSIISFAAEVSTSYLINLPPRKQVFNLSCEFAVASAIIHYFTKDQQFSPENERLAEKTLIEKVGPSQNPNLGVRMGSSITDLSTLFQNLNQFFGGADYYGIHAPPFIDLFEEYGLAALIIPVDENVAQKIQKAISQNHLVMAWIQIGHGKLVDVELSYGTVPVVKGEHSVVITGYDKDGVFVLDPAVGGIRKIQYASLLLAMEPFPMPLLEVYAADSKLKQSVEHTLALAGMTGLERGKFTISVLNGSGKVGDGNELILILKDFGYKVTFIGNADSLEYEDVTVRLKQEKKDYMGLLTKDLTVATYKISSVAADLAAEETVDAVIIVGN